MLTGVPKDITIESRFRFYILGEKKTQWNRDSIEHIFNEIVIPL